MRRFDNESCLSRILPRFHHYCVSWLDFHHLNDKRKKKAAIHFLDLRNDQQGAKVTMASDGQDGDHLVRALLLLLLLTAW